MSVCANNLSPMAIWSHSGSLLVAKRRNDALYEVALVARRVLVTFLAGDIATHFGMDPIVLTRIQKFDTVVGWCRGDCPVLALWNGKVHSLTIGGENPAHEGFTFNVVVMTNRALERPEVLQRLDDAIREAVGNTWPPVIA